MTGSDSQPQITQVLNRLSHGDPGAADDLLPLVYDELRKLARSRLRDNNGTDSLPPTALVHEAWMRLGGRESAHWENRAHFFGAAARAMRRILVEQARHKNRQKRGGGQRIERLPTDISAPNTGTDFDMEALDLALTRLETLFPRQAKIVSLHYFGGLRQAEIAEMLEVSIRTVDRDWKFSRSWLRRELGVAHPAR